MKNLKDHSLKNNKIRAEKVISIIHNVILMKKNLRDSKSI